ncbi:DNA polymerase beta superfamily protein [Halalkalibacter okhensis]|uniref:DNA polymerase beta superfamily protein n=1 Tax=Halalkalibacter okhensis TaxID=333138 RepID=UPI00068C71DA|nr:nucleotidyltransferase domain-containing protein [Halalkalibacter okhensis]
MERIIALKALVGSENYNLSTSESDKDFKVFVIPTFDDLYNNKLFTSSKVGEQVDEEYHDIRKVMNLWWKSNVNFLEVLFSVDFNVNDQDWIKGKIDRLFLMKNEIVRMNLPYLYKACMGMYRSKSKDIEIGNRNTKQLVQQFGYDSKSAMHAYRILDFIERFADQHFSNFKNAIQYNDSEREFMLSIKYGGFSKGQFIERLDEKFATFKKLEHVYLSQQVRKEVKGEVEKIIYQLVQDSTFYELKSRSEESFY